MSLCSSFSRGRVVVGLLAILALSLIASSAFAQTDSNPKWDLFAGYQWLHPGGTVPTPFGDYNNPTGYNVPDMSKGFGSALTYNFDPHWGIEFDLGHNWGSGNYETTGSVGPRFIWRTDNANYFLHTLISLNRVAVSGLNVGNGVGAILGGGMDLPIKKWLAFRLFEADYVWGRHNYAGFASQDFPSLERPSFEGVRLRTGLVFSWGGAPALVPAAACSVQPAEVLVGEPITATVTASNFNPKHTVTYTWSGNGGQITGKDTTALCLASNMAIPSPSLKLSCFGKRNSAISPMARRWFSINSCRQANVNGSACRDSSVWCRTDTKAKGRNIPRRDWSDSFNWPPRTISRSPIVRRPRITFTSCADSSTEAFANPWS